MERRCPILRTGCLTRVSLCHAIATLGTRRGCLELRKPELAVERFLVCRSVKNDGYYDTSLTRSQAGRRQKHTRRRAAVECPRWSPIEPATSRSEWLQGAKDQGTEVLLSALLAPESVPLPRLPVLLTLVESRSDLEECLVAAGLWKVAAAVLSSDMLQRLLPGGALLELLLGLVEQHAGTLATKELLLLARMIAAWRPPESCEALMPAAAAVATELAKRALELSAGPGLWAAVISGSSSRGGSADVNASAAAPIESDAAVLADAFIVLRPWLEWRSSLMAADSGVAGIGSGKADPATGTWVRETEEAGQGVAAEEVMEGVRTGVAALLRSVRGRAAAEPPVLFGVLEAALQYGIDIPSDFAKDAVRTATAAAADVSSSARPSSEAVPLATQLAAHACCSSTATTSGRDGGGSLLTAAEVGDLLKQHLAPQLGDTHHRGFLNALLSALHTRASQAQYLSKTQRWSVATPMGAERPPGGRSVREPAEGVLEALSSVAGQLGPTALVFAMECAAAVVAVTGAMEDAETEGPWAAGAHGIGEVGDVAVRLLLAEAAAEVAGRRRPAAGADVCTIDELCRLAAATARLQRSGVVGSAASDGATAAAATKEAAAHASVVLAAVQGLPLTEISIEAAAALVAAAWKATPVRVSWGQKEGASEAAVGDADGEGGDPPELPEHLLVALLERLAAATADPARIRRRADETRDGTNVEMASGTPPQPLPYEHALEVLTAVTTVAELMAETAPSTSASAAAASIPPERAEMLRAAGLVACRSLTPRVRELDAPDAVGLLMLVARAQRAGVRPDFPQLLWALHERLRALAASGSLAPTNILDVLSGCVSLRWRPAVLLRELLLPLLQWLEAVADGTVDAVFTVSGSASGGVGGQDRTAEAGAGGSGGMRSWSWSWSSRELRVALALLAKLRFSGPLATAVVKLGVGHLLRASEAEAGAATESSSPSPSPSSSSNDGGGARLSASDLALLMWVCVAMRYRGATVLRPLLQQLLQVPPAHVPVRAAAQAVWAAVRLGVVGERLVRWALASCQGGDKLAEAAPQNLALLCWGLAKLGVRPPRAFVAAAVAASRSQLRNFKAKELATALFVLATWGGKLRDAADAASVVRHVIETRAQYDGPGLCTAVWALNQLSAVATAEIRRAPEDSTVKPAAAASCILDAAALRAIETHLLAINLVENSRIGFPDHHLLRFFSTCAAIGYRPERLLSRYATRLHLRLRTMRGVSPVDVPVEAERRARMLWSSARIMATFDVRDPELLNALELCVERCQSQLRPGHLAGVLNAMAALGHYPEHFARHGLLRRVGLALRRATLTEAGLIMEALAVWKPYLTASGAGEETGSRDVGTVGGPAEEGNGLAAAAAAAAVMVVEARGPGRRGPTPQRLGLLRRMALARLTQLCAPPPPPTTTTTLSQSVQQPTIAAVTTSTSGASSGATRQSEIPPTAAPQTNTQTGTGDGFAAPAAAVAINISLDDAMRLLTALARLRWQCAPVEATLVQVLTRVPLERRRVPQLSTLMWSLASLRQDTPELLEDLQAALLGFPPQPSLASEMSLMESGRVDSIRIADASSSSLVAAAAAAGGTVPTETTSSVKVPKFLELTSTLTPLEEAAGLDRRSFAAGSVAGASAAPQPAGVANVANAADQSATSGEGLIGSGGITTRQSTRVDADVEGTGASDNTASSTASVGPDVAPSTSPRLDVQLLSRPAKPASSPADGDPDDATFDPAAATAAAAAEANQRLEKHLDGPMGRSQIPSEPWAPADIFKTLWSCAKMNRHPGPLILAAAERSWLQYTANGAAAAMPMHTITGLLWSLSVFRHHNGTFAQRLAQQLGNWLKGEGTLLAPTLAATATQPPATATAPPATTTASEAVVDATGDGEAGNGALSAEREVGAVEAQRHQEQQRRARDFLRQAVQVAACLLAAQADRADSPLNTTLSPEVRARLVAAWRSRLAQRLAKPPNRYQADLVSVLRKMGFTAAANVATPDGCALVDVAVAIRSPSPPPVAPGAPSPPPSPPRLLALELVGRHNTAANSPRILGEAVVKYRLLQARGYLVVPIPCYEWDRIDHKDIWTKMVYLQAKIERRTGSLTSSGVTVRAASTVGVPAAASLSSSDSDGNNNNNSGLGDGNGSGVGTRTAPQVVNALSAGSERRRNVAGSE